MTPWTSALEIFNTSAIRGIAALSTKPNSSWIACRIGSSGPAKFFRSLIKDAARSASHGCTRVISTSIIVSRMRYQFLTETYQTERVKVLSVWSMFQDADLACRPHPTDSRGRSVLEQMVHQCVSENLWFKTMLGIDVGAPPLPANESRLEFIKRYAEDSAKRLEALRGKQESWFEEETKFFDVARSRAWVLTRRLTPTSHHRGQQMAMLRMLRHDLHSNYGPTACTGGLLRNHAPPQYSYDCLEALVPGESRGGAKRALPGAAGRTVT